MSKRYLIQAVLDLIPDNAYNNNAKSIKVDVFGRMVGVTSRRIQTFKQKGTTCAHCGRLATHWEHAVDKELKNWKIILMSGGVEMTQDHVIPKSRGGTDRMDNAQTLCMPCNLAKGGRLESELSL